MKIITPEHWLTEVQYDKLPPGPLMAIRRFLVVHFTSGATAKSSINFWRSPEAQGTEAHIIIDRDGTIYQCRAFNQKADHAGGPGKSRWADPKDGRIFDGLNSCSIGIELANAGDSPALARKWTKLPLVKAAHKNGGPVKEWEAYPDPQLQALFEIAPIIVKRYNLDDVVGHDDIAPKRKVDPGPAFPMLKLRELCGFKGLPKFAGKAA